MTAAKRIGLVLAVPLTALLVSCGDRQSSTEVENENPALPGARKIAGAAMDTTALDSARWTAWDSTGTQVGTGMTDSVGQFSGALSNIPVGGLLVRVWKGADTLCALVPLDSATLRTGTVAVLVHPLTQSALPGDPSGYSTGFHLAQAYAAWRNGQAILDDVLGVHFHWRSFACDPNFRPIAPDFVGSASALSALVRAVGLRAARDGQDVPHWLASRTASQQPPVSDDSLFAIDLATSLTALFLPQAQTGSIAQELDSAADRNGAWVAAWNNWQILPDPRILGALLPWAVDPSYQLVWNRVVQATGDSALALENAVPDAQRPLVPPGRAHAILAVAIGSLFTPDSTSTQPDFQSTLDTLLARTVPQGAELLSQIRPDAWVTPPTDSSGATNASTTDPVAQLVALALKGQIPTSSAYQDVFAAANPSQWFGSCWIPFPTPQAAHDTLSALLSRTPSFTFSVSPLN